MTNTLNKNLAYIQRKLNRLDTATQDQEALDSEVSTIKEAVTDIRKSINDPKTITLCTKGQFNYRTITITATAHAFLVEQKLLDKNDTYHVSSDKMYHLVIKKLGV